MSKQIEDTLPGTTAASGRSLLLSLDLGGIRLERKDPLALLVGVMLGLLERDHPGLPARRRAADDGAAWVSEWQNVLDIRTRELAVPSWFDSAAFTSHERHPQWHSTEDYRSSSRAADNRFHGPFYQRFILYNGRSEADSETGRFADRDRTNLHCPLFDVGNPSNDVTNRASVMVHESWHHWQQKHGFNTSHMNGPIGAYTVSGLACDWYYFHGSGAFDFGQLD